MSIRTMELSIGRRIPHLIATVAGFCVCASFVLAKTVEHSDEITLKQEKIFVNVVNGSTFSLMVDPEEIVEELERNILDFAGIPYVYHLMRGETQLDLDTQLSDCNIRNGTILTLKIADSTSRRKVEFQVKSLDGKELKVSTQLRNSVASLKDTIEQQTGIPHVQQRLLLRGKELKDDGSMLAQFNLRDGTIINLGRPLEDCRRAATISVKTLSGATFRIGVNLADTVDRLKEKIFEKAAIPVSVQRLFANERSIAGGDYLCDHGLENGSTVYLILYTTRISSIDRVAKLQDVQPVAQSINPEKGPIFRVVEDGEPQKSERLRLATLYKDTRNWVARTDRFTRPNIDLFDPVAHLAPNPDNEQWMNEICQTLEEYSRTDASETERLQALHLGARMKLSLAVRPYRVAANLSSIDFRQSPGITLGGAFADVIPTQMVPLGGDVNNWAPDAFSDSDLMRLFKVAERVRKVLARSAQTGEGLLTIASQNRINRVILSAYFAATYPPSVMSNLARHNEECLICRDDLEVEPAMRLPCEHEFHADCILTWYASLFHESATLTEPIPPNCPYCKSRFMIPYEVLGEAELEKPDLQLNDGE